MDKLPKILELQFDEEKNRIAKNELNIRGLFDETIYWWKCPNCRNSWKASIYSRLTNVISWNLGKCGKCLHGLSFPQITIQFVFERLIIPVFPNVIINCTAYEGYEIDLSIDLGLAKNFGIEYDGFFAHKHRIKEDKEKNKALIAKYYLIRVREPELRSLNDTNVPEIKGIKTPKKNLAEFKYIIEKCMVFFFDYLKRYSNESNDSLNYKITLLKLKLESLKIEIFLSEIFERLREVPEKTRLKNIAPLLYEQLKSNNIIDREKVSAYSNEYGTFQCPKHKDHIYDAIINARTREYFKAKRQNQEYNGCPYCDGKKVIKENSFKYRYPELVSYFEYGCSLYGLNIDFNTVHHHSYREFPFSCSTCNLGIDELFILPIISIIRIFNSLNKENGRYRAICPRCHLNELIKEGKEFYTKSLEGLSSVDIARQFNNLSSTSVQRRIKLYKQVNNIVTHTIEYTKKELIEIAKTNEKNFTSINKWNKFAEENNLPNYNVYKAAFGNWNDFKKLHRFKINEPKLKLENKSLKLQFDIKKQKYLHLLAQHYTEFNKSADHWRYYRKGKGLPSISTIEKYFEKWTLAQKAVAEYVSNNTITHLN